MADRPQPWDQLLAQRTPTLHDEFGVSGATFRTKRNPSDRGSLHEMRKRFGLLDQFAELGGSMRDRNHVRRGMEKLSNAWTEVLEKSDKSEHTATGEEQQKAVESLPAASE